MEELSKNAQKELIVKISDIIKELESEECWTKWRFEWIQKDIKKKKRKRIIQRWNSIIRGLSDLDKLIIKLSNLDEDNAMIAYYLLSIPEWIDKLKELKPKVIEFVESGLWYRLFKKEVELKMFKSKALRMISLDSIIANLPSSEEKGDVTKKNTLTDSSITPDLNVIPQSKNMQTEDKSPLEEKEDSTMQAIIDAFNDPSVASDLNVILGIQTKEDEVQTTEPEKKKLSIKKENL